MGLAIDTEQTTMLRNVQWVQERAKAAVSDRVDYSIYVADGRDVVLTHEPTGETCQLLAMKWSNKDNSDDSVRKWIVRSINWWIARIARTVAKQNEENRALREMKDARQTMKRVASVEAVRPPKPRRRGRPPKNRKPEGNLDALGGPGPQTDN